MDLHRTEKRAQWLSVPQEKRNSWQRLAFRSRGVMTPGNVTSVAGALLVAVGLTYVYNGSLAVGLCLLLIGRAADVADGMVADYTHTKSPLGEAVDAVIDKFSMAAALAVFVLVGIVPLWVIVVVAILNTVNVSLGVISKVQKRVLHPSWLGKLSTGFQWTAFMLYVAAELLRTSDAADLGGVAGALAAIAVVTAIGLGVLAIRGYLVHALYPKVKTTQ